MNKTFLNFTASALLASGLLMAQAPASQSGGGWRRAVGDDQNGTAQSGKWGQRGQQNGPGRMFSDLNLTDDQKQQAKTIFDNARQSAEPVRQQIKQGRDALKDAVKSGAPDAQIDKLAANLGPLMAQEVAIRTKAFGKFLSILTPEQRAQAEQRSEGMSMRGRMHGQRQENQ